MKKIIFTILCLLSTYVGAEDVAKKYAMGIPKGIDKIYDEFPVKTSLTRGSYLNLPIKATLKNFAPYPDSQGQFGTCAAWAVAYSARTIVEAKNKNWTNRTNITENAFSPGFQFRVNQPYTLSPNCDGAYTSEVVKSLQLYSFSKHSFDKIAKQPLCPVFDINKLSPQITQNPLSEYSVLWNSRFDSIEGKVIRAKKSLSEGNPVVISMIVPLSFQYINNTGLWNPKTNDMPHPQHGRHAMTVVGYDDTLFGGVFEIQNSWGQEWGNQGYAYVKYEDFGKYVYQGFELISYNEPEEEDVYLSGSFKIFDLDRDKLLSVSSVKKENNWTLTKTNTENSVSYRVLESLYSGSRIRLLAKSHEPAFVYVLGTGSVDKSVATLFPFNDKISPALNYSGAEIALPSEDYHFEMDETVGEDYLILLYSKKKLDIDSIKSKFSNTSGSVSSRLSSSLGDLMLEPENIALSSNEISFEAKYSENIEKIVALLVETKHLNAKDKL